MGRRLGCAEPACKLGELPHPPHEEQQRGLVALALGLDDDRAALRNGGQMRTAAKKPA